MLPTLSFRAALGGLSYGGEWSREGERAPGPPSASDTGGTHMSPPSPAHPWRSALGGPADHPNQEGAGYLIPH